LKTVIKSLNPESFREAAEIYTEAFYLDPLFVFAFPGQEQRMRLTRVMYEFVVFDMVPILNLTIKGAFVNDKLAGCVIYTTPESSEWDEKMNEALDKMRVRANDEKINFIGEYARLEKFSPGVEHFYGNELAVGSGFRKRGIGKMLNDTMVEECKNHFSAKGIVIDTANENNVSTYLKWGWQLKKTGVFHNIKYFAFWLPVK
jgi:hypothetical protein